MSGTAQPSGEPRQGGRYRQGRMKKARPGKPLVSVITPVFQGAATLEATIRSVLGQRYDNVEYIVVDGGSDDGTVELLETYDGEIDDWVSEPDQGIYDAMNKGVDRAHGDWLYFLGADDVLVDSLYRLSPHLRHPATVYYGDAYMPGKNRSYDGEFPFHRLAIRNVCHQAVFYPRSVFEGYRYDLRFPILADYALNLRCWGEGRFKTRYVPLLIAIFNDAGTSSVVGRREDPAFQAVKGELVERYFGARIRRRRRRLERRARIGRWLAVVGMKSPVKGVIDRLFNGRYR